MWYAKCHNVDNIALQNLLILTKYAASIISGRETIILNIAFSVATSICLVQY